MIRRRTGTVPFAILILAILISSTGAARQQPPPQKVDKFKVEQGLLMLESVHEEVKKHYYDPTFHGVNIDAEFAKAKDKIGTVDSLSRTFAIIADTLDTLHDSHTFFQPPARGYSVEYGFRRKMIGDKCFVTNVRPGTDAEKKGLKPGDQILTINGYPLDRETLFKLDYMYETLSPQPGLILNVESPDGSRQRFQVQADIEHFNSLDSANDIFYRADKAQENERPRFHEFGDDLIIIQVSNFVMSTIDFDTVISKMRKHKAVVLDMRGNPGGAVSEVEDLIRNVMDRDVHIGDRITRGGRRPENVRGFGHNAYTGKITVILDSRSGSAAEVTSRVLQLEKRATVIGELSEGKVMEARTYVDFIGAGRVFGYATSVTEADLIMADGKSLENIGVTPDEVVLPTAADLAAGRDPVLARAAAISGIAITPEEAFKMFPYIWLKNYFR
jgi:carboxyl-terminal processing protease